MTTTDTNLNQQLIINELTQAEYNAATINPNELYVVTDGVMQSSDVTSALGYTPVNKAGDTMTGNLFISEGSPTLNLDNTSITKGSIPSGNRHTEIIFNDGSNDPTWANKRLALLGYTANSDGGVSLTIRAYKREAGTTTGSSLVVGYDANGNAYATAPTPASTSNSTNIATTEFCDGNWTSVSASSSQVVSSVSLNYSSNYSISLASILPTNDTYEIIVTGKVTTGTTSGNYAQVRLSVSGFPANVLVCRCRTRSNSAVEAEGTATILYTKGTSTLSLERSTDSNLKGTADLWILAYRKVR